MKLNGFVGTGSGKLGNSVFSVNSGEQVVRQYQPVVSNPSTTKQVNQRARLKLMSQLAASLSSTIAMAKEGMVSARNKFISRNYNFSYANGGEASITLENVQLTDGNSGLPSITASRDASNVLTVALSDNVANSVSRVVYTVYRKTSEKNLQLVQSKIVTEAGEGGTFETTIAGASGEIVIYAYGMRDTSAKATANYNNMQCNSGVDVATLIATRNINFSDYQFTQTRGTTMAADGSAITPTDPSKVRVYVTASGNGTVSGAGQFNIGDSVTVTATAGENATFAGWMINGQSGYVSTSASYTFTAANTVDLVAIFEGSTPSGGGGGGDGGFSQN